MRIVISLTTIPSRLENKRLIPTLVSLNLQTKAPDAIYLGLPRFSRRFQREYPFPDPEILKLCQPVFLNTDYGPLTKILAGLSKENGPETIIITCDDDNLYTPDLVENLTKIAEEYPDSALGSAGVIIGQFPSYLKFIDNGKNRGNSLWHGKKSGPNGTPVDFLCGFPAVLYRRKFFDNYQTDDFLDLPFKDPNFFHNDDITISAYLSRKKIERRIFPLTTTFSFDSKNQDGLSYQKFNFMIRFIETLKKLRQTRYFSDSIHLSFFESMTGKIITFLLIIIIIIFVIIFIKRKKLNLKPKVKN